MWMFWMPSTNIGIYQNIGMWCAPLLRRLRRPEALRRYIKKTLDFVWDSEIDKITNTIPSMIEFGAIRTSYYTTPCIRRSYRLFSYCSPLHMFILVGEWTCLSVWWQAITKGVTGWWIENIFAGQCSGRILCAYPQAGCWRKVSHTHAVSHVIRRPGWTCHVTRALWFHHPLQQAWEEKRYYDWCRLMLPHTLEQYPVQSIWSIVQMYRAIIQLLKTVELRQDVHYLVLTGTGEFFSSGNDLGNFTPKPNNGLALELPAKEAAELIRYQHSQPHMS